MSMAMASPTRRAATYERVSSEDQTDRGTIRTQTDELARSLGADPMVVLTERYADDGVSGTIPLAERPAGGRLMRDAAAGRFDELHVYKFDRLGRDAVDLLVVRRRLMELRIRVRGVVEGEPDLLGYDVQAIVADHARREFLRRSADGMNRAAREGRYTGGIVPYGYRIDGAKPKAYLVPDESLVFGDWSAADVVRHMYRRLALDHWSCRQVADELNGLGIPTHYDRDGRGIRGKRTLGTWAYGRIRNMIVEPVYRGERGFGKRSKQPRALVIGSVPPLVSDELWHAAQATLARHRVAAKNTPRVYLLRGVITCSLCGLTYVGSRGRDGVAWYRCGGQLHVRRPGHARCLGRSIRADQLEGPIWRDVEHWLRQPGDLLDELDGRAERHAEEERHAAEVATLERARADLEAQRQRLVELAVRGQLSLEELHPQRERVMAETAAVEARLAALSLAAPVAVAVDDDLLARLRANLDADLTEEQRQEIVGLLVAGITIRTTVDAKGTKEAAASIQYRFPAVVTTRTGTGSSLRRAGT